MIVNASVTIKEQGTKSQIHTRQNQINNNLNQF